MRKKKPLYRGAASLDEKVFDMPVPVFVSGKNAGGKIFTEESRLKNISAQMAVLSLENKVIVGEKLKLELDIPKTLILKNKLTLRVAGEVERTRRNSENGGEQIVEISLSPSYKIVAWETGRGVNQPDQA
jgi:hypothetical protein